MSRDLITNHLDLLSTRMSDSVEGENTFCVSAAAIAVAFDAAESITDIKLLQCIHKHLLNTAEEVQKLIAVKAS